MNAANHGFLKLDHYRYAAKALIMASDIPQKIAPSSAKRRAKRHSYINPFVVFPHSQLEDEWCAAKDPALDGDQLADQFARLLNSASAEQRVHDFFEKYPQALPGVCTYHNGPRGDLVVSKLPLGNDFVTDFAFVSQNSQSVQFTCVEIESPRKTLFTSGGKFSRSYLDAKQQISDWNHWAQLNLREATRQFGRLGNWIGDDYLNISLQCVLIMGRRSELTTPKKKQRWAAENALRQASMTIMTYDRVIERMRSSYQIWEEKMLVCTYRDRALHVKSIAAQ